MKMLHPKLQSQTLLQLAQANIVLSNLASAYRRSENVVIEPIVIFELTFSDVERQIFVTYLVVAADDAALEDAPKAFNRVRVDCADHVLPRAVHYRLVRVVVQAQVTAMFVGGEQTDVYRNGFPNEFLHVLFGNELQNASYYVALALYRADDRSLSRGSMFAAPAALADVFVVVFAADPRLINFDNAAELIHVFFDKCGANFVAHAPSGLDRTKAHVAPDLPRANTFFGGQHQMGNLEPIPQWLIRVLKDCASDMGKPIAVRGTLFALPMMAGSQRVDLGIAAAGANHTVRPAPCH